MEYEKIKSVGTGTYSNVFSAKRGDEEVCAMKIFKTERWNGIPVDVIREITTLKTVKSPHIIPLLDVDYVNFNYIILPIYETNLSLYLKEIKPSEECIQYIFNKICKGIYALHSNFIIHRDIKPSNVCLSHIYKGGISTLSFNQKNLAEYIDLKVVLIDYGMSKKEYVNEGKEGPGNKTPKICTIWYRAPEIACNYKNYSFAVDIWSAGCVLGEMHKGSTLFPFKSEIELLEEQAKFVGIPKKLPFSCPIIGSEKGRLDRDFFNFPSGFLFLLRGMLNFNPLERFSIADCLNSSYLSSNIPFTSSIPSVPPIPSIHSIPSVPSSLSYLSSIPPIPSIPSVPSIPSIPPIPSLSYLSSIPPIPSLSYLSTQTTHVNESLDVYKEYLQNWKSPLAYTGDSVNEEISFSFRKILVCWMFDLCEYHDINDSSYFISIMILDYFCIKNPQIKKENYQLLGITSLLISSKLDSKDPLTCQELLDFCQEDGKGLYSPQEVFELEKIVLRTVDLNFPNLYNYYCLIKYTEKVQDGVQNKIQENFKLNMIIATMYPKYLSHKFSVLTNILSNIEIFKDFALPNVNVPILGIFNDEEIISCHSDVKEWMVDYHSNTHKPSHL